MSRIVPRIALVLPLFLVGCEARFRASSSPMPQAMPTVEAAPAQQFDHLSPIQLPPGEYFSGFYTVPAVNSTYMRDKPDVPEHYFFSTSNMSRWHLAGAVNTLRDSRGVPVLIVKDPPQ